MFDCLDTSSLNLRAPTPLPAEQPAAQRLSPSASARQHAGRNWVRFSAGCAGYAELARVREVALYLNASVERLTDGSIVLLGLNLSEILALSERFGNALAVEAHIANGARAS